MKETEIKEEIKKIVTLMHSVMTVLMRLQEKLDGGVTTGSSSSSRPRDSELSREQFSGLTSEQFAVLEAYAESTETNKLTSWEVDFLEDQLVRTIRYPLSAKQAKVFDRIGEKFELTEPTKRASDYEDDEIPF